MREWYGTTSPGTSVIDPANGAEIARLINQDALINRAMGGLFPEGINLTGASRVLDVACGPGGWVQHVAFHYPTMYVVGVDIDQRIMAYARAQARVQALHNASFVVMDVAQPLPLPDASFDFVQARFLNSFLLKNAWPDVMREMLRITRPGGWLRLIEADGHGITSSQAFKEMEDLLRRAFTIDPLGRYSEIIPLLNRFLYEAGYRQMQEALHVMDFSADTASHHSYFNNLKVSFKLLQPYLIERKVATQERLDALYERLLLDMLSSEFQGRWYVYSICGQKAV